MNNIYGYGTSLSAPKVSAILGLIIEKFNLKNSPDRVENILYENTLKKNTDSGETIQILDILNFIK